MKSDAVICDVLRRHPEWTIEVSRVDPIFHLGSTAVIVGDTSRRAWKIHARDKDTNREIIEVLSDASVTQSRVDLLSESITRMEEKLSLGPLVW